jgi:type IV secretory pathway VirB4 component
MSRHPHGGDDGDGSGDRVATHGRPYRRSGRRAPGRQAKPGAMPPARPDLKLPWQRGSSAHVASVYPFSLHPPLCQRGALIGVDMLAGGGEFVWDPFEAYAAGLVTNPNVAIFGKPGQRKSTLVKTFLWRMFTLYGKRRWVGIADPKGEYAPLAERLGLTVVRLSPGGGTRVNPLAPGPAARHEHPEKAALRRAQTVHDLLSAVLRRSLSPSEEAILYSAVEAAVTGRAKEPTLADLAHLFTEPTEAMVARVRKRADDLAAEAADLYYGLQNLLSQSLRGMFDGFGTVHLDSDALGIVLDLSGIDINSPAMPLVLMTATGWLQEFLVCPGPQRLQITDELWVGAGDRHFIRHMQRCQKLGRTFGVANIQIAHKVTDAAAQADSGTAESKIAAGLLADADTKIVLRQDAEQLEVAQAAFGLTNTEREWIGTLVEGRALWLMGSWRAVVQHHLAAAERGLVDTDQRMRA